MRKDWFNLKVTVLVVVQHSYSDMMFSFYWNLFSAVFQLITSQIAEKYSALRFWYCKLDMSIRQTIRNGGADRIERGDLLIRMLPRIDAQQRHELANHRVLVLYHLRSATSPCESRHHLQKAPGNSQHKS